MVLWENSSRADYSSRLDIIWAYIKYYRLFPRLNTNTASNSIVCVKHNIQLVCVNPPVYIYREDRTRSSIAVARTSGMLEHSCPVSCTRTQSRSTINHNIGIIYALACPAGDRYTQVHRVAGGRSRFAGCYEPAPRNVTHFVIYKGLRVKIIPVFQKVNWKKIYLPPRATINRGSPGRLCCITSVYKRTGQLCGRNG